MRCLEMRGKSAATALPTVKLSSGYELAFALVCLRSYMVKTEMIWEVKIL